MLSHTLRLLDRERFDIQVALQAGGALLPEYRRHARTSVYEESRASAIVRSIERLARRRGVPGFLRNGLRTLAKELDRTGMRRWVRSLIADWRPDLVYHSYNLSMPLFRGLEGSDRPSIHSVTLYGLCLDRTGEAEACRLRRRAGHFIVQGRVVRDYLHDCVGIPEERIFTGGIGIDLARRDTELAAAGVDRSDLGISEDDLVIGGCGGLAYIKGVDLWLRAAAILLARRPELPLKLLWIGGRPHQLASRYGRSVADLAEELGLAERTRFTGERDHVYPLLDLVDIFVLSSRIDAFPHTVLEAMAVGKPVVSYAEGLAEEEYARDRLVRVGDRTPEALAAAIEELADDPARRRRLGAAGRLLVEEELDLERSIRDLERILLKVLDREREQVGAE